MQRLSSRCLPARPRVGAGGGGARRCGDAATSPAGGRGRDRAASSAASSRRRRNLLNFATYYQMKERAGTVGREGLNPLLREHPDAAPDLKLHLVGHSFGGRLVTAAAAGRDDQPAVKPETLVAAAGRLLAQRLRPATSTAPATASSAGSSRTQMVAGPIVITYTQNDRAVGLAYPIGLAARRPGRGRLGDKNDLLRRHRAQRRQKTPEAVDGTLLAAGGAYAFEAGASTTSTPTRSSTTTATSAKTRSRTHSLRPSVTPERGARRARRPRSDRPAIPETMTGQQTQASLASESWLAHVLRGTAAKMGE